MSRARFKVLAGVFGASVCGLAALAQPPVCMPTTQLAGGVPCPLPKVIAVQATLPSVPVPSPSVIPAAGTTDLVAAPLPKSDPLTTGTPNLSIEPAPTPPPSAPVVNLPLPGVNSFSPPEIVVQTPTAPPPAQLVPVPAPELTQAVLPPPAPGANLPPVTIERSTIPPAAQSGVSGLGNPGVVRASAESDSLQVCLKLGDGHPKFEVCRGDDVLLKVVCSGVDVKAPSEKGEPFSVLRASGMVRFTAPGCEGTCDELVVHPVTGDVILTKGVEVKCKLGKGSTVMKAEQMTFKLGTAPAFAVTDVTSPITPTSGRR